MRYLITGGLGVIGSCLAKHYLENGHEVTVIDPGDLPRHRLTASLLEKLPGFYARGERLETMPLLDLHSLLKVTDVVIHAAAHTGIPHSIEDPTDDWVSNVEGTRKLLEALRRKMKPIPTVVLSSVKPYAVGDLQVVPDRSGTRWRWADPTIHGIDEVWPMSPDEPYAASKLAQSAICQAYAKSYGLPIVTFRCSNLYGPAPCHGPRHGWATWFAIAGVIEKPIRIEGTGLQVRDLLFWEDVRSACDLAVERVTECAGEIFNLGGAMTHTLSVREGADLLDTMLPVPLTRIPAEARKMDDPIFITNIMKFNKATGWWPKVKPQEGLLKVVDWAKKHKEELETIYAGV